MNCGGEVTIHLVFLEGLFLSLNEYEAVVPENPPIQEANAVALAKFFHLEVLDHHSESSR